MSATQHAVRWGLAALAVAGLAVDAYTHFDLASTYRFNATSTVSEASLFRVEAVLAVLAAVALLVRRNRLTALLVVLVAGGGLVLLLVYRYVDIGRIGPLPSMYDPEWFPEKVASAVGEVVALVAGLALLVLGPVPRTDRPRRPAATLPE
jgi:hypothetical protein